MMKKIVAFLLSFALLTSVASCRETPAPYIPPAETQGDLHYTFCDYINDDSVKVKLTAPDESLYYRNLLKKEGKEDIYDEIVYAASHLSNPVEGYENVTELYFKRDVLQDELIRTFVFVYLDHPELWYLCLPAYNGCVPDEESLRRAYLTFSEPIADIPAINAELLAAVNGVSAHVSKGLTSTEEIASAIAGWLCANCRMSDDDFSTRASISMREVFSEKVGTCLANSFALTYLLQKCGIPAFVACGSVGTLTYLSHFWVISVDENRYYYTDVYYMGQVYNRFEENPRSYLLMDSPELLRTRRTVEACAEIPLAGSTVGSNEYGSSIPITKDTLPPSAKEE